MKDDIETLRAFIDPESILFVEDAIERALLEQTTKEQAIAALERVEKALKRAEDDNAFNFEAAQRECGQRLVVEADRDSLRAKLDRAKAILRKFPRITQKAGGCSTLHDFQIPASTVWANDAFLSELSADAPAQQTQISDEAIAAACAELYKRNKFAEPDDMRAAITAAIEWRK